MKSCSGNWEIYLKIQIVGADKLYEEAPASPKQCAIVEIVTGYVYGDRLDLSTVLSTAKKDLKNYFIWKAQCQSTKCPRIIEKDCSMITDNLVSCSLCAFEMDNPDNSCAREFDAGTTYANALN